MGLFISIAREGKGRRTVHEGGRFTPRLDVEDDDVEDDDDDVEDDDDGRGVPGRDAR